MSGGRTAPPGHPSLWELQGEGGMEAGTCWPGKSGVSESRHPLPRPPRALFPSAPRHPAPGLGHRRPRRATVYRRLGHSTQALSTCPPAHPRAPPPPTHPPTHDSDMAEGCLSWAWEMAGGSWGERDSFFHLGPVWPVSPRSSSSLAAPASGEPPPPPPVPSPTARSLEAVAGAQRRGKSKERRLCTPPREPSAFE